MLNTCVAIEHLEVSVQLRDGINNYMYFILIALYWTVQIRLLLCLLPKYLHYIDVIIDIIKGEAGVGIDQW